MARDHDQVSAREVGWPQLLIPAASWSLYGGASGATRVMPQVRAGAHGRACPAERRWAPRSRR